MSNNIQNNFDAAEFRRIRLKLGYSAKDMVEEMGWKDPLLIYQMEREDKPYAFSAKTIRLMRILDRNFDLEKENAELNKIDRNATNKELREWLSELQKENAALKKQIEELKEEK